jgi:hypothetical protein
MSIVLVGSTSGSCTLQEQAVAGTTVLTLPAVTGTILTTTSPKAGNVIQVVSTTKTDTFTTTSNSFTTITGLTASITPTSSTSKILIIVNATGSQTVGSNDAYIALFRDSTQIALGDSAGSRVRYSFMLNSNNAGWTTNGSVTTLDSPSTTSAITYSVRGLAAISGTLYINRGNTDSDNTNGAGRTVSSITVMEIAA